QRVRLLAAETVRSMYQDAEVLTKRLEHTQDDKEKERLVKTARALLSHGLKSEATPRVSALLQEAQKLCVVEVAQLDQSPWLLNCANGTVDLRDGHFRPSDRHDLVTKCLPTPYDPAAACPLWEQFLHDIMGGNEEVIDFLWKAVGYSLTGDK